MTLQEFANIAKKSVKISIDYTALEQPIIDELTALANGISNPWIKGLALGLVATLKAGMDKVIADQPK